MKNGLTPVSEETAVNPVKHVKDPAKAQRKRAKRVRANPKMRLFNVRLTDEEHEDLKAQAQRQERTVANLMRVLILQGLERGA